MLIAAKIKLTITRNGAIKTRAKELKKKRKRRDITTMEITPRGAL